ncbi:hypothetical protein [Flavobacterium sp. ZB4P13]|uniref:hypothetical protein n=1 Tax=Flavobacterium sp. ZB4P13 TaxID=3401728 RepID=UPI003AAA60A6
MKTINGEEFLEILYSNKGDISISDYTIDYNKLSIDFEKVKTKNPIFFQNLTFTGKHLNFYNQTEKFKTIIQIEDCTFNTSINIQGQFDDISFRSNTFNCNKFQIINSKIGVLEFIDNDDMTSENKKNNIFNKGNFKIHNCDFSSIFWLKNVQFMENTTFDISSVKFLSGCFFDFTSLNKIMFYSCDFLKEFRYDCNYNSSQFRECNFSGPTTFLGLFNVNLGTSILWLDDCTFSKLANFNRYFVHKLLIEDTTFRDNVSLQKTYLNIITIVRTVFEKKVWFENIQINQIDNCDIETIRTIKQELQKAENKIDFSRFRVYEFNAYRKDIRKKLIEFKKDKNHFHHRKREPIQLKRDLFILDVSDIISEYGTDWKRAMKFTLMTGFTAFSLFFILENIKLNADLNNWQDFLYGYFRFFLITDFKNEYYETGESILKFNCFLSLIPFILGKILVAFGIYEMIQSFRKFKA